jgi:hypothetical protein
MDTITDARWARTCLWAMLLLLLSGGRPGPGAAQVASIGPAQTSPPAEQGPGSAAGSPAVRPGFSAPVDALDLLTPDEGWVLAGGRLFWTHDGGQTWLDITPPAPAVAQPFQPASIAAASFPDPRTGFVVSVEPDATGSPVYALARTADGGATWQWKPLPLFAPGDPAALPGRVSLQFVDARTGWLAVKRATSANFSLGTLFHTDDGGVTWARLELPTGEPVWFLDVDRGWTAGGAAGDELYRSVDGGRRWEDRTHLTGLSNLSGLLQVPAFSDPLHGLLAVVAGAEPGSRVEFYITEDGGGSWRPLGGQTGPADPSPGVPVPIAALGPGRWLAALPGSAALLRLDERGERAVVSRDPALAGLRALDMAGSRTGWALAEEGRCDPECRRNVRLLRTADGGRTWVVLDPLPRRSGPALNPPSFASGSSDRGGVLGLVAPTIGQGFDKCEIPTLNQLQAWKANSPYGAVNLYIGGVSRACSNRGLTAGYVSQAGQQGWRFIPTWVGLQAPCTGYSHRMSWDPGKAYGQGAGEADQAAAALADLGLAYAGGSGGIVYVDVEAYDTADAGCRAAVNAFISGWTEALQAAGSLAGAYGADCGSAVSDWWDLPHPPDQLWVAHWDYSYYNPGVTVFSGMLCLDDWRWPDHQRVRQYTGGHNETWGGVQLNIDCDVIDGVISSLDPPCCACPGPDPCWHAFLPAVLWKGVP